MWKVEPPKHHKMKNTFSFQLVAPYKSSIKTFHDDGIIREASVKVSRLTAAVMRKHKVPQSIIDLHCKPAHQRLVTPPIMPKIRPMKSKKTNNVRLVKNSGRFKPTREQLIADISKRRLRVVITRLSQEVIDSHLNGQPKRKLIQAPKRRSEWTHKPILPSRQVTEKTFRKPAWLQEKNLTVKLIKTPAESSLPHPYILNEADNNEADNHHAKEIISDPGLVGVEIPPTWVNGGYSRDQVNTKVPNFSEEIQHGAMSISLSSRDLDHHDQSPRAVTTSIGPSPDPVHDHVDDQNELVRAEVRFDIQRVSEDNQPAPPSTPPTTSGPLVGPLDQELPETESRETNAGHQHLEDDHDPMAAKMAATPADDLEFLNDALFDQASHSANISFSLSSHNESTHSVEDLGQPGQDMPILTVTEKTYAVERNNNSPQEARPPMSAVKTNPVYLRCVDNSIYGQFYPERIRAGYRFQYPYLTEIETDQAAHTFMARIKKAFTNPLGYDKATQTYEPPNEN